ncbi:GGDEF domain-containing protein [Streptomyces sp. NBC_00989]|uniref:GGDEF domain-containing protein n=1 Tax=Streptomyces sp. NBC_00989 TaxID=2903705 RepID=UPI002F90B9C0|nr:GGDEF domain-containing protein [Streptomyces sp. NBC_00989]
MNGILIAAAVPAAGWAAHVVCLYRRLAATRRDPLTGLLRRDAYTAKAQRLLRRNPDTALVVMVDQDRFKRINDTLGHAAGDVVLQATAARLADWAGPHAAVGRLGGDEFALVLHIDPNHRHARLGQLVRMLHVPVPLDDEWLVPVAASVGAAAPDLLGTHSLKLLQRAADAALYDGKHSGRAVLAAPRHATVPSANGRRLGRPGTARWGQAA